VPGLYITESVYSEVAVDYIQSHGKLLKFIQFTKETHEGHRMEALVLSIAELYCELKLAASPMPPSMPSRRTARSCKHSASPLKT
jgi:hypothetical protein